MSRSLTKSPPKIYSQSVLSVSYSTTGVICSVRIGWYGHISIRMVFDTKTSLVICTIRRSIINKKNQRYLGHTIVSLVVVCLGRLLLCVYGRLKLASVMCTSRASCKLRKGSALCLKYITYYRLWYRSVNCLYEDTTLRKTDKLSFREPTLAQTSLLLLRNTADREVLC